MNSHFLVLYLSVFLLGTSARAVPHEAVSEDDGAMCYRTNRLDEIALVQEDVRIHHSAELDQEVSSPDPDRLRRQHLKLDPALRYQLSFLSTDLLSNTDFLTKTKDDVNVAAKTKGSGSSQGAIWIAVLVGFAVVGCIVYTGQVYGRRGFGDTKEDEQGREKGAVKNKHRPLSSGSSSSDRSEIFFNGKVPNSSGSQNTGGSSNSIPWARNASLPTHRPPEGLGSQGQTAVESRHPVAAPVPEGKPALEPASPPPQLCPALVLPTCESRFVVPVDQIAAIGGQDGEFEVLGMTGNPLLRCSVCEEQKGSRLRRLEVAMAHPGSAPRAIVSETSGPSQALELLAADHSHYARLEPTGGSGSMQVSRHGQTLLLIDGNDMGLDLTIVDHDGKQVATVCCSSEHFAGVEHLEIKVMPGTDPVLVVSCVMAVVLLCSDEDSSSAIPSSCVSNRPSYLSTAFSRTPRR